jgi:hypothetical protein
MSIQGPKCPPPDDDFCPATAFQKATVSVPVSVNPFLDTGDIEVHCVGNAVLSDIETDCEETGGISFVISQRICVEIPFKFSAAVEFGDTEVSNCRIGLGRCRPFLDQQE